MDDESGEYSIGTVAELLNEHPETLRVWERNGLIRPDRNSYQRKYSHDDLKRLRFIKNMMDEKGLNIAGVRQVISMYSCWYQRFCRGGALKNNQVPVNESKPCWKREGTFCLAPSDKSEFCQSCEMMRIRQKCTDCSEHPHGFFD